MLGFNKTNRANVYVVVSSSLNLTNHVSVLMYIYWYIVEIEIVIFLKNLFNIFSNAF